jgi:hypothetical protein
MHEFLVNEKSLSLALKIQAYRLIGGTHKKALQRKLKGFLKKGGRWVADVQKGNQHSDIRRIVTTRTPDRI